MPVNEKTIELVRQSSAQPRAWSGAELRAALGLG
jgi:hypothetical protein